MITKLALLPRILPGLFRRLPAATSVGYRMPRTRWFFAGVSGSVALHAAVLFGISPPPPGEGNREPPVAPPPIPPIVFGLVREEPPPPTVDPGKNKNRANSSERGEERSRIPELPPRPEIGPIVMEGVRPDPGKAPDAKSIRWDVPHDTGARTPRNSSGEIIEGCWLDKRPVVTSSPAPRYPFDLKHDGLTGTALLRFVVDSRGDVSEVEVVSATHPEFGAAAAEAMLKWKFKAGMKDGRRVATRMELPIKFSLENG